MHAPNIVAAVFAASLLAACTHTATYNPAHFQYAPRATAAKLPGTAAIQLSAADQNETYTGKPTSFTGGGTTLTLPIGAITREAGVLAFRDLFSGGAEAVELPQPGKSYSAIIRPKVRSFTYEYNQLKNAGFAITPTAVVSLEVQMADAQGNKTWQKSFDTGNFEGETYFVSGSPGEEISKTAHRAIMKAMQDAAAAVQHAIRSGAGTGTGTATATAGEAM